MLLRGKHSIPVLLHIVQHKGYELHFRLFAPVLIRLGLTVNCLRRAKQVRVEAQAQQAEDNGTSDPEMNSAKASAKRYPAAVVASVFDISTRTAGCPIHWR